MAQSIVLFLLTVSGLHHHRTAAGPDRSLGSDRRFQPTRTSGADSQPRPGGRDLAAAVAINSIIFNSARFIGPAVAGVMIVAGGIWPPSPPMPSASSSSSWRFPASDPQFSCPATVPGGSGACLADVAAGIRYAAHHPGIAPLLLLLTIVCICVRPVVELLPGFAAAVFASRADGLAVLTSTVGAGAVLGGLWLARRSSDPAGSDHHSARQHPGPGARSPRLRSQRPLVDRLAGSGGAWSLYGHNRSWHPNPASTVRRGFDARGS